MLNCHIMRSKAFLCKAKPFQHSLYANQIIKTKGWVNMFFNPQHNLDQRMQGWGAQWFRRGGTGVVGVNSEIRELQRSINTNNMRYFPQHDVLCLKLEYIFKSCKI